MALQKIVRHYAGDDDSDGNYKETSDAIGRLTLLISSADTDGLSSVELDLLITSSSDCDELIELAQTIKDIVFND